MRKAFIAAVVVCLAVSATSGDEETPGWKETLERVARAVVAVRADQTRAFDGEWNKSYQASGFVVDAERGIILTNRHVVSPGPTVAEAVFLNHEEVPLVPIYRDPVHDFGFYRFDPGRLSFMQPPEIALAPERAQVGTEIRVVGNDAGEKLSILAGTLARVDRPAPIYNPKSYNDFNTFYIQAASGTSGGSSGSPVVDIEGRAVALNAGSRTKALSSFYFPLDRVVRALDLIRQGKPVTRGTIQTVFERKTFGELQRLGLRLETESWIRELDPELNGLLVAEEIVPGGPSDGILEQGDVLLRINGDPIVSFVSLETVLDDSVGREVNLEVERGGQPLELVLEVQDLRSITPDSFLEVGGAVLHDLSYQQARSHAVPVEGVYVASSGYLLDRTEVPRTTVITSIAGREVQSVDDAEAILTDLADGQRVQLRYFELDRPRVPLISIVAIDRSWFPMRRCTRDDESGQWNCRAAPDPPPKPPIRPTSATFSVEGDRKTRGLARSLVWIDFFVPYRVDAVHGNKFGGTGLVVDAEKGLVVTDRSVVAVTLGDVVLTFAGSVEVPGRVVFVHPLHNLAVVSYDPALIGDTPVQSAELKLEPLSIRDRVRVVALAPDFQVLAGWNNVVAKTPVELPYPAPPRYRESNLEALVLSGTYNLNGVLANDHGKVVGLWSSFSYREDGEDKLVQFGIPSELVAETVRLAHEGRDATVRTLGAELGYLPLARARYLGLSADWVERLEAKEGPRRALAVRAVMAGSAASEHLRPGDLLLAVNGEVVTSFRKVEQSTSAGRVRVTILRDGVELTDDVETTELSGQGTNRVVMFAGALVHEPHPAIALQRGFPRDGVYVSYYFGGSPASRHKLYAAKRIVEVDDVVTPNLDTFLEVVSKHEDRDSLRLKTVDLGGKESLITLRLDLRYWPTYELRLTSHGWTRTLPTEASN